MPHRAEPTSPVISDAERAALLLDELRNGFVLLDEAVIELADIDSWGGLTLFFAARVELPPEIVRGAIEALSDEPVMALCRAAGVPVTSTIPHVMAGLVPAIHVCAHGKTWMPGHRLSMTGGERR